MLWIFAASVLVCAAGVGLYAGAGRFDVKNAAETPSSGSVGWSARIFWTALACRIGVGFLIGLTATTDYFAPDRFGYELAGAAIADSWRTGAPVSRAGLIGAHGNLTLYHYYNGAFFFLFGELAPWAVRSANGLVGALSVPLAYGIAKMLGGEKSAVRAAWLVALVPSLILWTSLNIRDGWAVFAILFAVFASLRLRESLSLSNVATLVGSLALLGAIRGYIFLIVGASLLLSFVSTLGGRFVRNFASGFIVLSAVIYFHSALGYGKDIVESASFEALDARREGLVAGESSYYEGVDISSPGKAARFLPIGVTYFLFAPFPWQVRNSRQAITLPEMVFWWFLAFRFLLPGIVHAYRLKPAHALTALAVVSLISVAYGLVEGNVGTAYRHRAQVLPLLIVFCSIGWELRRRKTALASDGPQRPAQEQPARS